MHFDPRKLPRLRINRRARDVILRQLSQRSTVVALLNAGALLAGWHLDPQRLEALGLLLSFLDTVVLAAVQERGPGEPPPPPTAEPCDGGAVQ